MSYLIVNIVLLVLVCGFVVLSVYETEHGVRFFARERTRLDEQVARVSFVLTHVDFNAFTRDLVLHFSRRAAHAIAHLSLLTVRAIERFLTRIVRSLRIQHSADLAPHENTREFVKTLSDFKGHLENTRPDVPDILS